jgi:type IX secretion system PorP/SprF family membrane protein
MNYKVYISILFIFLCVRSISQQMPSVSMFDKNLIHLNPAATGDQGALSVGFSYRKQWTGIEGAPSNQIFSAHAPLKNPNVAIGLLLENESSGITNYTGIYLNYAYRLKIVGGRLSFGLKGGINAGSQSSITLRDNNDPAYNSNNNNFVIPNFGFGILFNKEKYWAGASIPRIFGFKTDTASGKYKLSYDVLENEYFFVAGGKIQVSRDMSVEPSVLVDLATSFKTRISVNLVAAYKGAYKIGIGYRSGDAIIFQLGYNLNKQLSFGYSYDYNIGSISKYTSGSHEINMQYRFGYQVNASSPRYF